MKLRKPYFFAINTLVLSIGFFVVNYYFLNIPECINPENQVEFNRCAYLTDEKMEQGFSKLSYPKIEDKIWTVNGVDILPTCLEMMWISGDDYKLYEEQFPHLLEIYRYPGKYWGDMIHLDTLKTNWEDEFRIPKKISECNVLASDQKKETKGSLIKIKYSEDDDRELFYSYRLFAEWGEKECSKALPRFQGKCRSLVFVKMQSDTGGTIYNRSYNSYAYITHLGEDYVVPVTNKLPLKELLGILEN